jgi:acyl-CoA synthetase (NDP forming)
MLLKALRDTRFHGDIAGVNPKGGEVHGLPLYRKLDEVPFPVEMAVLIIPPQGMAEAVADCARRGVKGIVIPSEGFSETGSQGEQYQNEIRGILKSSGMRGFGPNTLGIVNTETGLTTSYFSTDRTLRHGSMGFVTQSGIFIGALLRYMSSFEAFRISKGLGLGNKIDVDESEALAYLGEDEQTRVVGMYLEDVRDGRRFLEVAREAATRKPVLMLKGGRTTEGARATATHTASLAVQDDVFNGALRQAGVLRMRGIDELMATLLGFQQMPLPRGGRVALVTYSGAQAIMSIDAAMEEGLRVAEFKKETRERLAGVIATASKTRNPVDLFPDMMSQGFEKVGSEIMKALLADDGVDGIVFISFGIEGPEPLRPLAEIIRENNIKPVFFSMMGDAHEVEAGRVFLEQHEIPFYLFPEMAIRVMANMWQYARFQMEA